MSLETDIAHDAFPETQWSLIGRAKERGDAAGREALTQLLRRYQPALRAHLERGKNIPTERAADLLQGFIADKVIEQNLLEHALQSKGRFRSFLLVTLNHYVASSFRAEFAAKRTPTAGLRALTDQDAELAGNAPDPAEEFTYAWARTVVAEAIERMRAECQRAGRMDLWTLFDSRVVRPAWDGSEPSDYAQLVAELGLATPLQACALLTTAKRMFLRNLRAVTAEYADPDEGPDAEINDLKELVAYRGRRAQLTKRPRNQD